MWKVMLVDDEPFIRRGLKILINWEQYGYEIAAEAENGFQAIDILEKENIDLVFVDLKMPGMTGLEMIERVRDRLGASVDFVILTGFADFDYAKEAIRLSVRDYLLKPIQEKELVHILGQLGAEYREDENTKEAQTARKRLSKSDSIPEEIFKKSGKMLEQVEQYVQENYNKNISLKSLGEHFYINNVYLGQIFKREYGFTFRDYLNRLRIEKAMELLAETDDKIYMIAEQVGFSSVDYFVNKFIQEKGITPRRYRMELKKEGKKA